MELTLVDVYADVVCPFAYVGLSRFIAERTARGRDDVVLYIKAWPLEWVNNGPMDGHAVAEKGAVLRASVVPDLFARVDAAHYPTTSLAALELTASAYEHDPRVGERVAMELRRRLFDEGADIGDPAIVTSVAAAFGLAVPDGDARVRAQYEEGRGRGVKGSPHFFPAAYPDQFCPSLVITRPDGTLHVDFDQERFAGLLRATIG